MTFAQLRYTFLLTVRAFTGARTCSCIVCCSCIVLYRMGNYRGGRCLVPGCKNKPSMNYLKIQKLPVCGRHCHDKLSQALTASQNTVLLQSCNEYARNVYDAVNCTGGKGPNGAQMNELTTQVRMREGQIGRGPANPVAHTRQDVWVLHSKLHVTFCTTSVSLHSSRFSLQTAFTSSSVAHIP